MPVLTERMDPQRILKKSSVGVVVVFSMTALQFLIAFGTQVVLARLLAPEQFGAFAFAAMVALFFNSFANLHGDKYLIREKYEIHHKINIVFTFELIVATIIVVLVIILIPPIMGLLGKPHLTTFVQVLTVVYFYNPFSRPRSLFEKDLSFFRARYPMLASNAVAGAVAIALGYFGFGAWSLVFWRVSALGVEVVILWCITPYRPQLAWDTCVIRDVMRFGWPLLGSATLIFFYWNVDYYIVSQLVGQRQLGYYWLAFQTTHYLLQARSAIISVVYPAFSATGDREQIGLAFGMLTRATAILYLLPTLIVLVLGEPVIVLIFGAQWAPATTVFQIFMVGCTLRALTSYWEPIFLVFGRTKILLAMTMISAVGIAGGGYIGTSLLGIEGMALVVLAVVLLITPLGLYFVRQITGAVVHKPLGAILLTATAVGFTAKLVLLGVWTDTSPLSLVVQAVVLSAVFCGTVGVLNRDLLATILSHYRNTTG